MANEHTEPTPPATPSTEKEPEFDQEEKEPELDQEEKEEEKPLDE